MAIELRYDELHRLTIDEYHQLVRAGGFDEDARIELIDGLIVDMSPKTPQHESAVAWLADWLRDRIDRSRLQVRVGAPITIENSEPEPDLALVSAATPAHAHPHTAQLIIEVSHTSLHRDVNEKPGLYARAEVPEYWVIDLDGARAIRHSDPRDGEYRLVTVHGREDELSGPGALDLAVAAVLTAAGIGAR